MGVLANPAMLMYIGTDKEAPGFSVTGLLYGNFQQLVLQAEGAAFIIVYNVTRPRMRSAPRVNRCAGG